MSNIWGKKECVLEFLANKTFSVPDFQREYAWGEEQCSKLLDDLIRFGKDAKPRDEYFLGAATFWNKGSSFDELEIIDGQQRIITLTLLLKALYAKLETLREGADEHTLLCCDGLQSTINESIWRCDPMTKKPCYNEPKIVINGGSKVHAHEVLLRVLSGPTLETETVSESLIGSNCAFFAGEIDDRFDTNQKLYEFIVMLSQRLIFLPIVCGDKKMALTIFKTLNDRGLGFSDEEIERLRAAA